LFRLFFGKIKYRWSDTLLFMEVFTVYINCDNHLTLFKR